MENYQKMIEARGLVITRHYNPRKELTEWSVGRIYSNGEFEPVSFGSTIENALDAAHKLIRGDSEDELE